MQVAELWEELSVLMSRSEAGVLALQMQSATLVQEVAVLIGDVLAWHCA